MIPPVGSFAFAFPLWLAVALLVLLEWRNGGDRPFLHGFCSFLVQLLLLLVLTALSWVLLSWLGVPHELAGWSALALTLLRVSRRRRPPEQAPFASDAELTLAGLMLLLAALPSLNYLRLNGFVDVPDFFTTADQPWHFSIAISYAFNPVPLDMTYAGSVVRYATGYPLLAVIIAKATYTPFAVAYFVLGATLIRLALFSGFILTFVSFKPRASVSNPRGLAVALVALALFVNFDYGGAAREILSGAIGPHLLVKYIGGPSLHMQGAFVGSLETGVALLITFIGLVRYRHFLQAAPLLGYLSFVKPMLFLPAALVYAGWAAGYFASHRSLRPIAAGAVALGCTLLLLPFSSAAIEGISVGPLRMNTFGYVWMLTYWPRMAGSLLPFYPLLFAGVLRYGRFLLARARAVGTPIVLLAGTCALSYLSSVLGWMTIDEKVEAWYDMVKPELTPGFEHTLALEFDAASQQNGRLFGGEIVLIAVCATHYWLFDRVSHGLRIVVLGLFSLMAVGYGVSIVARPQSEFVDVRDMKQALRVGAFNAVYFTNRRDFEPERPFRNVIFPGASGRQFFAANFEYGNIYTEANVARLREVTWFWETPFDAEKVRYLDRQGIRYLFVDREVKHNLPEDLNLAAHCLVERTSVHRYRLLELISDGCAHLAAVPDESR